MNNSIVNLGDLAKPADTLIKKVSSAIGGIFAPSQIRRVAKAEAEAAIIRTEADIKVSELQRRAMRRFVEEEARKQSNIEDIVNSAIPNLAKDADAEQMDNDWIANFFEKARIVSNQEMQSLWSQILAGEANAPGTYSRRTVNFLADLDRHDADLFTKLCGFAWDVGTPVPLVFDTHAKIYEEQGVTFNSLSHLESIGLIKFNSIAGFSRVGLTERLNVSYFDESMTLEFAVETGAALNIGVVLLTKMGEELFSICGSVPVDGFVDYVRDKWSAFLPQVHAS